MKRFLIILAVLAALFLVSCESRKATSTPPSYHQAIEQALELLKSNRPEDAEKAFNEILLKDPGNTHARLGLGASLMASGRMDEAGVVLKDLYRTDSDNPKVLLQLAAYYREINRPGDAEKLYLEAVRSSPGSFLVLLDYSRFLAYERKSPGAIDVINKALELEISDGRRGEALITRACIYQNSGRFREAREDLTKALECLNRAIPAEKDRHDKTALLISRAFILKSIGRPHDAEKDLTHAIDIGEMDAECCFFLTGVYIDMDQEERAFLANQKYESLDRDFRQIKYRGKEIIATYHRNMGSLWFNRGELDRALKSYEKSLEIEPDNMEGLIEGASIMFMTGRIDEAGVLAEKFLSRNPPSAGVKNLFKLAAAFRITGDTDKALLFINRAIREKPDDFGLYFERAFIFLLDGREKDFLQDMEKLKKLAEPEHARMAGDFFSKVKENRELYTGKIKARNRRKNGK